MPARVEFLIIGQGLAGTALAWELLERGRDVLVTDAEEPVTSSKIAAGLITPITGQRLALSWRVEEMLAAARPFYERIASTLGRPFYHPRVIRRIFRHADEAALWEKRRHEPARHPFIHRAHVPEAGPFGGVELHGAHLECADYLAASRRHFQALGCYEARSWDPREAADFPAGTVVFCQGYAAARNPLFAWLEWRAAKGEILTVQAPAPPAAEEADARRLLSAGQWLVPASLELARTGSTYDWHQLDTQPTEAARQQLEAGLAALSPRPWRTLAHHAAVRPILRESQAVIGRHPVQERLAFFNGLGSKGSLHAPFFAHQLAAHLIDGEPLEEGSDLRRN